MTSRLPRVDIQGARHPVIEKQLPLGAPYIANDLQLDREKQQIMMITGPNMSGKSALLRQTALISLIGSDGKFCSRYQGHIRSCGQDLYSRRG